MDGRKLRTVIGNGKALTNLYIASNGINYSILNDKDKTILDAVIKKFKNFKAKEIVNNMHEEKVYKGTNPGDIIPSSIAKEIKDFQSLFNL